MRKLGLAILVGASLAGALIEIGGRTLAAAPARAGEAEECGPIRRGTMPNGDVFRFGEYAPAWSPDGGMIAFGFHIDSPAMDSIFVSETVTRTTRRVAGGELGGAEFPSWSPSGRRLAFGHGSTTATIGVDGRDRRELRGKGARPIWSPDGCWIALSDVGDLYVVRPDGTGRRSLGVGDDPAWSPDGRRLAFSDGDIWLADVGTWKTRRLISPPGVSILPVWSPDGTQIAYAMGHPREDNFFGTWSGGTIFVLDVATGRARRLTGGNQPSWSPDGGQLAFIRTNGCSSSTIWIANADGTAVRQLTKGPVDLSPAWSPDGRRLAFSRAGISQGCLERRAQIWLTSADGLQTERLTRPYPAQSRALELRGLAVAQAVRRLRSAGYRPLRPSGSDKHRYRISHPIGASRPLPDWRVCTQQSTTDPSGGATIDLVAAPACVVAMPALRGKTLRLADRILARLGFWAEPESAAPDMSKADIEWSWRVCTQQVRAGTRLKVTRGRFITLGVAPRCPG